MAHTNIPVQIIPANGGVFDTIVWTAGDAANDHEFENTGRELLLMKSTTAGAKAAVVASVADEHGRTGDTNLAPTGSEEISVAGPFRPSVWGQGAGDHPGSVLVTLTDATGVEFAVVRFTSNFS